MREIRDPVHGFIHRTSVEEEIIDTLQPYYMMWGMGLSRMFRSQ